MCWTVAHLQEAVAELDSSSTSLLLKTRWPKRWENKTRLQSTCSSCQGTWNEQQADHFQAHSAQEVMQMQLAISHEPTVKVPWGPSVQGAGAQSPGRHAGWRYPYTHKDWGAQATPQPPPFPRGELLEMEKQECIEYPESQETGRDEDTTAPSARGGGQAGPQPLTKGRAEQPSVLNEEGRAKKVRDLLLRRGLLQYNQEEAYICFDVISFDGDNFFQVHPHV